jgi:large subunit ribosomal protein L15
MAGKKINKANQEKRLNFLLKTWGKKCSLENQALLLDQVKDFYSNKKNEPFTKEKFLVSVEESGLVDKLESMTGKQKKIDITASQMLIDPLAPTAGQIKKGKRVGRGPGSGCGKTSTRGMNGQKARKGGGVRLGFEGGQTALYRRLPKRGFSNSMFKKEYNEVNVFMLDKFDNGAVVNVDDFKKAGLQFSKRLGIKILGNGEITKKLEVHAHKFTKSAVEKIEKAGGKAVLIK